MKKNIILTLLLATVLQVSGQWNQLASYPLSRKAMFSFTMGGKAYMGGGFESANGVSVASNDFYEFDPQTNVYTKKANLPGAGTRISGFAFAINGKGYITGGVDSSSSNLFTTFEYDPTTDAWAQKQNIPGTFRVFSGYAAAVNGKGYVFDGTETREYDPVADAWTIKPNPFPKGINSSGHFGFVLGSNIYITGGVFPPNSADLLMYDTSTDTWTTKSSFPGGQLSFAFSFSLNGFGYVCGGLNGQFFNETTLRRYNPNTDTWQVATGADFPNDFTAQGVSFTIGNNAYLGTGEDVVHNTITGDLYSITLANIGLKEEIIPSAFEMYPNPSQGKLSISLTRKGFQALSVLIMDSKGKIVHSQKWNEDVPELDLSLLTKGIYIVQIEDEKHTKYSKKLSIR